MKPGVRMISDGLWQGALAHASMWSGQSVVDVAVLMASPAEPLPPGMEHIIFPIDDNANGCDRFAEVQALAHSVSTRRVLTVCHMGENRSGLLSALILVDRGTAPAEAVRLVQERGPHNSPTQGHSFWNPGFVRQVEALDA